MTLFVATAGGCDASQPNGRTTSNHGGRNDTLVIPDGDTEITTDMAGNWHPVHGKHCVWSIVLISGRKHITMASGEHGGHAFIFTGYSGGTFHSAGCGGWH